MPRSASHLRRFAAAAAVALAVAAPLGFVASAHGPELGDDRGGLAPTMPAAPSSWVDSPAGTVVFDDHGLHPEPGDDHGGRSEPGDDRGHHPEPGDDHD